MYPTISAINNRILVIDDNPAIHADFAKVLSTGANDPTELDHTEAELFGQTDRKSVV